MNPLIQLKKAIQLSLVAVACFAFSPMGQALLPPPPPDGGYPGSNTAEGHNALFNLTTGIANSAVGEDALRFNTTGGWNTAIGAFTLLSNTTGSNNTATGTFALESNSNGNDNTANGYQALFLNRTGDRNTASGRDALAGNTSGGSNTATGADALGFNTGGSLNTANGTEALFNNTTAWFNTAMGSQTLFNNTTGLSNTANGYQALYLNQTGGSNTATGVQALYRTTGGGNIALGFQAGMNLTSGSNNIDIGNAGVAGESNKIRIGRQGTHNGTFIAGISGVAGTGSHVVVNAMGKLGVAASSARFKDDIKPIDKASEAIHALKPVTFRYKKDVDPEGVPQFGLVAEEVEKVNPNLVVRDTEGKVYTVRYEAVNAMLLNEFLKEHRKVRELEANATTQQKEIKTLATTVKEQAAQIQKVSAQLEASKPATQVVNNP